MSFGSSVREVTQRAFRRKSVAKIRSELLQEGDESTGFHRCLSLGHVITYGVAATVGAGIFVTSGSAVRFTGPALFISFAIAGFSCVLDGLCFAEFSSRVPAAGSAYSFAYTSLGELCAVVMGWVLFLPYGLSGAITARGSAGYLETFLASVGAPLPWWLSGYQPPGMVGGFVDFSPVSAVIVILCTWLCARGTSESTTFSTVVTALNAALIAIFVFCGGLLFDKSLWTPLAPHGCSGIVKGAGILFFCFIGFEQVSTLAEEMKDPQRNAPRAILYTLLSVTVMYASASVILVGMVPIKDIDLRAPLAEAFAYHGLWFLAILVSLGAVTTTICTTFTCILSQPRIFYRMARDGLLLKCFGVMDPTTKVPVVGTWLMGVLVAVISGVANFDFMVKFVSCGTILSYSMVCVGLLLLRLVDHPIEMERSLKLRSPSLDSPEPTHSKLPFSPLVRCAVVLFWGLAQWLSFSLLPSSTVVMAQLTNIETEGWGSVTFQLVITGILLLLIGYLSIVSIKVGAAEDTMHFLSVTRSSDNRDDTYDTPLLNPRAADDDEHQLIFCNLHFKCPCFPLVPLAAILINSFLVASLELPTFLHVFIYCGGGVLFYLLYGWRNSALNGRRVNPVSRSSR